MDNYVGKRLEGRYEIQEIVGVGGMSVVYKAYDSVDDRVVAVKILKEEFSGDADFVRRFKNESKAIAVLSHPNIVRVYDVSFGEKLQYIVMEYVDGITLKEYIQKQKIITWNDAVFFTNQILRALQHAHDKGIVHRDIKPQNIILLPTGDIKVTDFGIARFSRTETRTLTEDAIGSVHYMSPEQAKGELTDERADIYSLGAVLYEMLSGRVPFEAQSAVSVALMQVNQEPRRLTEINPDIPAGLEQICFHAMQKNADDRYQTATEMLLDIEEISANPAATFDYSYFIDKSPTKYVTRDKIVIKDDSGADSDDSAGAGTDDKRRKKKIIIGTVLGVIVLIAAVVGLIAWLTQEINAQTYSVENFVGQYYDDIVSNGGYNYELVAQYEETDKYAAGVVIAQTPEAGDKVVEGTTVTLTVAQSDDDISVPNCYNLTLEKAQEVLESYNLTNYTTSYVSSETVNDGYVIYTNPKASTVVSADEEIVIYVSSGPSTTTQETITIPSVEGLSQSDAQSVLSSAGFTNVSIKTQDSTVTKGVVISQSPAAGVSAIASESIIIVVSTGVTTTTTTQPAQYTLRLYVYLPECVDESGNYAADSIVIYVDGEEYLTKEVTLDGTYYEFAIPADSGTKLSATVELEELGAEESFTFTVSADKDKTVDFTPYSDSEEE
ncbi:MAG: Stk1 family PASTA domain-containing Ser/Thr kinase [Clostridiales bacterium]|nr:Stk1 family PASTA domain-containing Ser/Thr kinase [Clostridiales bacterium]